MHRKGNTIHPQLSIKYRFSHALQVIYHIPVMDKVYPVLGQEKLGIIMMKS